MAYGIMFHHFHNDSHPHGQGSISAKRLTELLQSLQKGQVLDAQVWLERAVAGTLEPQHRCLTFDDALLCQYEVALPVLQQFGIKAFWFVYSSVFEGNKEFLEIYRYFRSVAFANVDTFYQAFFGAMEAKYPENRQHITSEPAQHYLAEFSFYTTNDRIFRYLRDEILTHEQYTQIMSDLMRQHDFDIEATARRLWMNNEHLLTLHRSGHSIGLHSRTHPTRMERLPTEQQHQEYANNSEHLQQLLGIRPTVVAHPCNSYNAPTLEVLRNLGIILGFRSNRADVAERTLLEMPREDHVLLNV